MKQFSKIRRNGTKRKLLPRPVEIQRIYSIWTSMHDRCNNENYPNYHRYGGRGISVCERWDRFETFLYDMGKRPRGTSIERVDNNKGYGPRNCKWATPKEQGANQVKKRAKRKSCEQLDSPPRIVFIERLTGEQMKKLGEALREAREKKGISQGDLAKAMGYTTAQFVSNWERGLCAMPPRQGQLFCKLTGMSRTTLENLFIAQVTRSVREGLARGSKGKWKAPPPVKTKKPETSSASKTS